MKKPVMISVITLFLMLSLFIGMSSANESTLFENKYWRTTGSPNLYTYTFPATIGAGKLIVTNGHADGKHRISSALILINEKKVLGPNNFNQKIHILERPVNLAEYNSISVELRGKPGGYLIIQVIQQETTPIILQILSPNDGDTIIRPEVMVEGTITNATGNETGVTVNGILSMVDENQFVANHVPPEKGENTITATATDTDGNTATASINVNALTTGDYIKITADTESGISPLETTLRIEGSFSFTESYLIRPDEVQVLENPGPEEYRVRMTTEGIYYLTAAVRDAQDITYTDTIAIQVLDKEELDAMLRARWEGMRQALTQNDIDSALRFFDDFSKDAYKGTFTALLSLLPEIAQDLGNIQFIRMMKNSAEYDIRAVEDGKEYSYYLLFVRDEDGLWKIKAF